MSTRASLDEWDRIEALLQTAEGLAQSSRDHYVPDENEPDEPDLPSADQLHSALTRALAQLDIRRRYFPPQVASDNGWGLLLDLFSCELQAQTLELPGSASRWGMSEVTAARHVAGLVAANLVVRVAGGRDRDRFGLELTDLGRALLKKVLALYQ